VGEACYARQFTNDDHGSLLATRTALFRISKQTMPDTFSTFSFSTPSPDTFSSLTPSPLQTILNLIDFQMPVKEAVASPRIHHQWLPDNLIAEADIPAEAKRSLERRGHNVRERGVAGVVQAIRVKQGKTSGAVDPRKEERARTE